MNFTVGSNRAPRPSPPPAHPKLKPPAPSRRIVVRPSRSKRPCLQDPRRSRRRRGLRSRTGAGTRPGTASRAHRSRWRNRCPKRSWRTWPRPGARRCPSARTERRACAAAIRPKPDAISLRNIGKMERAKGFEPSTPTLAKYFSHFSQTLPSAIIYAKSYIYDVPLYDCLRP